MRPPAPLRPPILPPVVVALDVETTGLSGADRIVSIGMVRLETAGLAEGNLTVDVHHAFCNPGRRSHWAAAKVHGIKDAFLAAQPPFADFADEICQFLSPASLVLAHNAAFDRRFLTQELALSGRTGRLPPWQCTLQLTGAKLDLACAHLGLTRTSAHHGALEDAWLALMVYLAHSGVSRELLCGLPAELAPSALAPTRVPSCLPA